MFHLLHLSDISLYGDDSFAGNTPITMTTTSFLTEVTEGTETKLDQARGHKEGKNTQELKEYNIDWN